MRRDIVVVGASAGGVEVLRALVATLPADFPGRILVVMHLATGSQSALPVILDRSGALHATVARHHAPLAPGTIHVAPPDRHLLLDSDRVVLSGGPTESGHRPAINALFRSAAVAAGPRVIGVVLTGVLDDGAAGLRAVADRGGLAIVQDPADALHRGMPEAALRLTTPIDVIPASRLGALLDKLVRQDVLVDELPPVPPALELEDRIAHNAAGPPPRPSAPPNQVNGLEHALWTALRSLDEKTGLARRMQAEACRRGHALLIERYRRSAEESAVAAKVLREYLITHNPPIDDEMVL